jgi:hypothetical protein
MSKLCRDFYEPAHLRLAPSSGLEVAADQQHAGSPPPLRGIWLWYPHQHPHCHTTAFTIAALS